MKRTFASLAALALYCIAFGVRAEEPAQPIVPTTKIELFNGKDLTGWVSHLKDDTDAATVWSVKDGVIACTGKPNGYLSTEKSYANYQVTVEWRFTRAGNTGVLVHINPPDKVWPMCIECQGMHDHQGDFWIWSGAKVNEPLARKNGVIMTVPSARDSANGPEPKLLVLIRVARSVNAPIHFRPVMIILRFYFHQLIWVLLTASVTALATIGTGYARGPSSARWNL